MKTYLIVAFAVLTLIGCKEETAPAHPKDEWGLERMGELERRVNLGECAPNSWPEEYRQGLPTCLENGMPVGDIGKSPYAAFVMAFGTLTQPESLVNGFCRTMEPQGNGKTASVDHVFWGNESEAVAACIGMNGDWNKFAEEPLLERRISQGECAPNYWPEEYRQGLPTCLQNGMPVGDIGKSPYAAFVMAFGSLTQPEAMVNGFCRTMEPQDNGKAALVDHVFWGNESEAMAACIGMNGDWNEFADEPLQELP